MNRRRFFQATVGLYVAGRLTPAAPVIPRRTIYACVRVSADEIRSAWLGMPEWANDGTMSTAYLGISRDMFQIGTLPPVE